MKHKHEAHKREESGKLANTVGKSTCLNSALHVAKDAANDGRPTISRQCVDQYGGSSGAEITERQ